MRLQHVKLGKKPAQRIDFELIDYVDKSSLPTPPAEFGHYNLIADWNMYQNERLSCCVEASYVHGTRLMGAEQGVLISASNNDIIADYSAITGYNPNDPKTDDGTEMADAAEFRRKIGTLCNGTRYKVDSYVSVKVDDLFTAIYLFGPVDIGFEVPDYLDDILKHDGVWDYRQQTPKFEGGHCITGVGRKNGNFVIVSWGRLYEVTPKFFHAYCDEAFAYISPLRIKDKLSPEQIDVSKLEEDLRLLGS